MPTFVNVLVLRKSLDCSVIQYICKGNYSAFSTSLFRLMFQIQGLSTTAAKNESMHITLFFYYLILFDGIFLKVI